MPATAVTISSLSRSANVVNVTTSLAHGLAVGQATWLQNITSDSSFQGIYVVATVPNGTTFTFNQTGANATPAAAGTVLPAKQWVAEQLLNNQGGEIDLQVEMWFPVTSGNELPGGSGSSLLTSKLSQDEINAISAGRILVESRLLVFPNNYTGAQMQAYINALYSTIASFRSSTAYAGQFYGYYSDGTANLGRV